MLTKASPCPKCGCENIFVYKDDTTKHKLVRGVECAKCGNRLKLSNIKNYLPSVEDAIETWNSYCKNERNDAMEKVYIVIKRLTELGQPTSCEIIATFKSRESAGAEIEFLKRNMRNKDGDIIVITGEDWDINEHYAANYYISSETNKFFVSYYIVEKKLED